MTTNILPCKKCKLAPEVCQDEWIEHRGVGIFLLVCPKCGQVSDFKCEDAKGQCIKAWNKKNKITKNALKQQLKQNQFVIDESRDKTNCSMGRQYMTIGRVADDPNCFKIAAEMARKLVPLDEEGEIE